MRSITKEPWTPNMACSSHNLSPQFDLNAINLHYLTFIKSFAHWFSFFLNSLKLVLTKHKEVAIKHWPQAKHVITGSESSKLELLDSSNFNGFQFTLNRLSTPSLLNLHLYKVWEYHFLEMDGASQNLKIVWNIFKFISPKAKLTVRPLIIYKNEPQILTNCT